MQTKTIFLSIRNHWFNLTWTRHTICVVRDEAVGLFEVFFEDLQSWESPEGVAFLDVKS
jgi:hypothetical protein